MYRYAARRERIRELERRILNPTPSERMLDALMDQEEYERHSRHIRMFEERMERKRRLHQEKLRRRFDKDFRYFKEPTRRDLERIDTQVKSIRARKKASVARAIAESDKWWASMPSKFLDLMHDERFYPELHEDPQEYVWI